MLTPAQILESIAGAYRNGYTRAYGDEHGPAAAQDALDCGAFLARLKNPARVGDAQPSSTGPLVCAGEHVIAWPRGRDVTGKRYVAWHPSMGIDFLLHVKEADLELVAVEP